MQIQENLTLLFLTTCPESFKWAVVVAVGSIDTSCFYCLLLLLLPLPTIRKVKPK